MRRVCMGICPLIIAMLCPACTGPGEIFRFSQVDFNFGGEEYKDSEWGCVDFTFTGVEEMMYLNLTVNGTWGIRNVPVLGAEGPGVRQTMSYYFDLGIIRGTDVTRLKYGYAFTPDILSDPPKMTAGTVVHRSVFALYPGARRDTIAGGGPDLAPGRPLIGGKAISPRKHAHKGLPNQQCGRGECLPAGASNNLKFLNSTMSLGMPEGKISIEAMKAAVGFSDLGTAVTSWSQEKKALVDWWTRKQEYLDTNAIPIVTRDVTEMEALVAEIDNGRGIEIIESWEYEEGYRGHAVSLVGITELTDGRFVLDVVDDRNQGDPARGCENPRSFTYDPKSRRMNEAGFSAVFEVAVIGYPSPGISERGSIIPARDWPGVPGIKVTFNPTGAKYGYIGDLIIANETDHVVTCTVPLGMLLKTRDPRIQDMYAADVPTETPCSGAKYLGNRIAIAPKAKKVIKEIPGFCADFEFDPPDKGMAGNYTCKKPGGKGKKLLSVIEAVKKLDLSKLELKVFREKKASEMITLASCWMAESRWDGVEGNDVSTAQVIERFMEAFATPGGTNLPKMPSEQQVEAEKLLEEDVAKIVEKAASVSQQKPHRN